MKPVVVVGPPRTSLELVDRLATFGVATVHEAIGRTGYLGPGLRPAYPGARVAGTAVTVLCAPGDNLMVHVAVEQTRPGDVMVVATTGPSTDGYFGELLATALVSRGVRGVVTDTGVRDVAELTAMAFPMWSRAVSAQGTVKMAAGAVNVPIVIGGTRIEPGDVVVADDDGVVRVARLDAAAAVEAAEHRVAKEASIRAAFWRGELGVDLLGLRTVVEGLGVEYVAADPSAPSDPDEAKS